MKDVKAIDEYVIFKFLREEENGDEDANVLYVVFKSNGAFFTQTFKYYDVSEEKEVKIREVLDDYTKTNQEATELCRTISMVTFICTIEDIVFDRR